MKGGRDGRREEAGRGAEDSVKASGLQQGVVEAPPACPPGCLVMPGDIFMTQLGGGGGRGHRTASTTENCRAQSVRGPKVERPCYELGSLKRGPLRFLNRRDPTRDDEFSSLAWGGQELLGCLRLEPTTV